MVGLGVDNGYFRAVQRRLGNALQGLDNSR
ncbi:hypothetical protein SDC9_94878 [bioreactor metagenome]|uniref:Uncharacterized protein n=1 Tax=bioreactor metagenome TaxID=1076179 RepID=A0A645A4N3_9ZZZZ